MKWQDEYDAFMDAWKVARDSGRLWHAETRCRDNEKWATADISILGPDSRYEHRIVYDDPPEPEKREPRTCWVRWEGEQVKPYTAWTSRMNAAHGGKEAVEMREVLRDSEGKEIESERAEEVTELRAELIAIDAELIATCQERDELRGKLAALNHQYGSPDFCYWREQAGKYERAYNVLRDAARITADRFVGGNTENALRKGEAILADTPCRPNERDMI